jgi:hypothetical protein
VCDDYWRKQKAAEEKSKKATSARALKHNEA